MLKVYGLIFFLVLAGCAGKKTIMDVSTNSSQETCLNSTQEEPQQVQAPEDEACNNLPEESLDLGSWSDQELQYIPDDFVIEDELREQVVDLGLSLMDTRYRYGGVSYISGFDCSGLMRWVFDQFDIHLPRTSRAQATIGKHVSKKRLRKGDLVFFKVNSRIISHVGLYIGGGAFLHANRTGGEVKVSSLSNAFWSRKYAGARRVLPE